MTFPLSWASYIPESHSIPRSEFVEKEHWELLSERISKLIELLNGDNISQDSYRELLKMALASYLEAHVDNIDAELYELLHSLLRMVENQASRHTHRIVLK